MFKLITFGVTLVLASAQSQENGQHGHGHAVSSQNIVLHSSHEQHHAPIHHGVLTTHVGHNTHYEHGHQQIHHGHQQVHHHDHHNYHHGHEDDQDEYHGHPKYAFEYKVSDPHTGDNKYQHESRDGDVVHGVYSLHEADGTIRTVKYSADKHSGFNAEVHREGHAQHVVPEHHHGH